MLTSQCTKRTNHVFFLRLVIGPYIATISLFNLVEWFGQCGLIGFLFHDRVFFDKSVCMGEAFLGGSGEEMGGEQLSFK